MISTSLPLTSSSFINYLSRALLDSQNKNGCRSAKHPLGRAILYFTYALNHVPAFLNDLGLNGYFLLFGLRFGCQIWPSDPTFKYNDIPSFSIRLREEIMYIRP